MTDNKFFLITASAFALAALSAPAFAEDAAPATEQPAAAEQPAADMAGHERGDRPAIEEAEHPTEPSPAEPILPLELSGFVDASYSLSKNKNDAAPTNTFSFDKFKIEAQKHWDNVGFRADAAFNVAGVAMEQGYVHAEWGGQTVRLGRFYAPIGFEVVDARDSYQYSHAMVFNHIPAFLTGISIAGAPSDMIDYVAYIANGWDINADNNGPKAIGGRLGLTPSDGVNIGLSPLLSMEQPNNGATTESEQKYPRIVVDVDGKISSVESLVIGFEVSYGMEKFNGVNADTGAAEEGNDAWIGGLVMAHYDYNEWGGVTGRIDYFGDMAKMQGGGRMARGTNANQIGITAAPTFLITDKAGVVLEGKYTLFGGTDRTFDPVAKKVVETDVDDNNVTVALEGTYSF